MLSRITLPLSGKGRSLLEKLHLFFKTSFVTLLKNEYGNSLTLGKKLRENENKTTNQKM